MYFLAGFSRDTPPHRIGIVGGGGGGEEGGEDEDGVTSDE